MNAWGKTGRVTVNAHGDVIVDSVNVGWAQDRGHAYVACSRPHGMADAHDLPSLDAAVMWVLAHARGDGTREDRKRIRDVWRAERGDVWQVRRTTALPILWSAGPVSEHWSEWEGAEYPWRAIAPDGVTVNASRQRDHLIRDNDSDVIEWERYRGAVSR